MKVMTHDVFDSILPAVKRRLDMRAGRPGWVCKSPFALLFKSAAIQDGGWRVIAVTLSGEQLVLSVCDRQVPLIHYPRTCRFSPKCRDRHVGIDFLESFSIGDTGERSCFLPRARTSCVHVFVEGSVEYVEGNAQSEARLKQPNQGLPPTDRFEALSNQKPTSPHHYNRLTSPYQTIPGTFATVVQRQVVGDAINTDMNSRVASASDLAFLNQPYHPVYSPFAAKPVLVHQYANSVLRPSNTVNETLILTVICQTQHVR
jgi:hypothetical protein